MQPIIEIRNLQKVFKIPKKSKDLSGFKKAFSWAYKEHEEKVAVQDINLTINKGEILGYLGPNGAGKSTTIKMITGILHPTTGDIKIHMNNEVYSPTTHRKQYTQHIGVVFGQRSILNYDIPVKDSFRLFKAIYGLTEEEYQERVEYLVKMLDITPFFEVPYRKLSLGEKMRCELAASFLHKPKIVFLDEPTIGLDASAKLSIRKFLKDINKKEGVTIIITTHDMDDIEELCKRIIFIDKGTIGYEGSLTQFKHKYSDWKRVDITYNKVTDKTKFKALEKMQAFTHDTKLKQCSLQVDISESLGNVLKKIVDSVDIHDLSIHEPKLENIVARMYEQAKQK